MKPRRIFSESFKKEKVRLYETGKMTMSQISRTYGVSQTSLYKWLERFRTLPKNERIVVETDSDYIALSGLQKRVDNMERLIGNQQIKIDYLEALIKVAGEHYGEDIEKKFG